MITFLLLWGIFAAVLIGWSNMQGHYLLVKNSRGLKKQLGEPVRRLLLAERRALTQHFHLAFHCDMEVYQLSGKVVLVGWREPLFLLRPYYLDGDLLVGLPESLYCCVDPVLHDQVELVLNPHEGAPHAFVVRLNGVSLLCDCEVQAEDVSLPPMLERPQPTLMPDCQFYSLGGLERKAADKVAL